MHKEVNYDHLVVIDMVVTARKNLCFPGLEQFHVMEQVVTFLCDF